MPDTYYSKYLALQRSFYINLYASVLGGGAFLIASLYVQKDKKKVDDYLSGRLTFSEWQDFI